MAHRKRSAQAETGSQVQGVREEVYSPKEHDPVPAFGPFIFVNDVDHVDLPFYRPAFVDDLVQHIVQIA